MDSSQFINQQQLSRKQLPLHLIQQNQKYFVDNPQDNYYQQSRCQHFTPVTPPSHPQKFTPNFHQQLQPSQCFKQPSPSHRRPKTKKNHRSDPNCIEMYIDYENQYNNSENVLDPSVKWNRRNIAVTMEKYEPTVQHHHSPNDRAHVTMPHKPHVDCLNETHQSDYAYAYYEPGAPMRHQNIPAGYYEEAGPSRIPPPNSIRALLSTARSNHMQRTSGKYSIPDGVQNGPRSQDNVYEEIYDAERRKVLRSTDSVISLNQSLVEEEFRQVHNRHQRVLGELNLSVEEMLMPPHPSTFIPTSPMTGQTTAPIDFLGNGEVIDGSSGAGNYNNLDLDSGFSGSNSSYIGSLRYKKSLAASSCMKEATIIELPVSHQHTDSGSYFSGAPKVSATDETGNISLSSRSASSLYDSAKKRKLKCSSPSHQQGAERSGKGFWKGKGWRSKLPGFSSTSSINKVGMDEQKSIPWEDPLPRSNSILSSPTNTLKPQSIARKSNNSILSLPQRNHSYNLNTANNNQETNFHNPQILNINNIINNNHLVSSTASLKIHSPLQIKSKKKLEYTPSARSTVSSEDSWCPSEDHDNDDTSLYNDDDDNLSDRSTGLISAARNSQLRLTFNKAKQHLSFDKWRNSSTTMPTSNNQESHGEPLSRLSRWFSIRRGSHQYDLNGSNSPNRSGSVEKDNDEKLTNGKKMPQLQETEEDHSHTDGASPLLSQQTRMDRRTAALVLLPAPSNLTQPQLKRRHIISAIVHSENSYVSSLQRLVKDYKKPLEESNPPILNNSKMSILFHRVPDILQCHTLLRLALCDCIRNWDRDEKIGDVFMGAFSKTNVLDVYSGFINNFSNAMDLAKVETKRKSAFADFLNVKQISAHDRLSFFGLMVKPVQRFPQFILFLQDLLKYTPQGHHDRMALQMALTQLESLADSLNERKREAEQYQAYKEMLGQISGPFNTRFIAGSSSDQRHNYLLREDNVTHLEFSQNGVLVKTKPRRLILANDKVICVSVAPKQSQDFGSTEKLSLKWMYHVNDVEIVDNASSATLNRYITSGLNRGGSLKSNHSGSGNETSANSSQLAAQLTNGAENLANEMSGLMHDYHIMSRVNDLVGQLKGDYPEINLNITKNALNTIQTSIRKKDEEMAWVDSCCLQLIVKQKSGKEETLSFRTDNPNVKKEWITELRLAQLALDTNNSPAWEAGDRDSHQRPLTKFPLFVRMLPVYKSTQHQTEVRCGCYYSMSPESKFQKRTSKIRYYLWVCSVDGLNSHITILLHQPHQAQAMVKDVSAFSLNDTVITAMDFVRGRVGLSDSSAVIDSDCIWLGAHGKKLIIYGGTNPEQEKQIVQLNLPDTPTQIMFHVAGESVFVALANGDILMYRKEQEVWNTKHHQIIKLDNSCMPITSILAINMNVYAASGRKIFVLNGRTGDVQKSFEIQHVNSDVNLMAHAGVGLWISLKNSSIICLYHTETFKHLQDINIAPHILRVTSSNNASSTNPSPSIYVTALMACKGLLWVGTNVGIALTVPLPRLEGVPIISDNVNISYHAHCGPVTFFLPLITKSANPIAQPQSKAPLKVEPAQPERDESVNNFENNDKTDVDKVEVAKLEKQRSLDVAPSPAKLKNQLPKSPIVLRRKSNIRESDLSRISKTLPRGFSGVSAYFNGANSMRSSSSSGSSQNGSDSGCDVYGLYSDLLFVKEDFDPQMTPNTVLSLHEQVAYDSLRRGSSDPDLAAIPSKVSTLDRRLKMKVGRPRSLDLSNWSVDSRSSSLYTSSGSEESMGVKYRSVSRNSSNASHKFNGTELMNINEMDHHSAVVQATSTPMKPLQDEQQPEIKDISAANNYSAATLKNNKRKNLKNNYQQQMVDGRRTVLMVMGGRGYVNWRNVFSTPPTGPRGSLNVNSSNSNNSDGKQQPYHLRSNSLSSINYKMLNSTDANVIIWEKKL